MSGRIVNRVDLIEHIAAICKALGLEPRLVHELHIKPDELAATIYATDANGKHLMEPTPPLLQDYDPESHTTGFTYRPATNVRKFEIRA